MHAEEVQDAREERLACVGGQMQQQQQQQPPPSLRVGGILYLADLPICRCVDFSLFWTRGARSRGDPVAGEINVGCGRARASRWRGADKFRGRLGGAGRGGRGLSRARNKLTAAAVGTLNSNVGKSRKMQEPSVSRSTAVCMYNFATSLDFVPSCCE